MFSFPLDSKDLSSEIELLCSSPRLTFHCTGELEQCTLILFMFLSGKMETVCWECQSTWYLWILNKYSVLFFILEHPSYLLPSSLSLSLWSPLSFCPSYITQKLPEVVRTHISINTDSQKTGIATFLECGYFKVDLTNHSLSRPYIFWLPLLCIHCGPVKEEKEKGEESKKRKNWEKEQGGSS